MGMRTRGRAAVIAVVLACLLAAGCQPPWDAGGDDPPNDPGQSGGQRPGDDPPNDPGQSGGQRPGDDGSQDPPPTLRLEADCKDPDADPAPESFDAATWDMPSGFERRSGYAQIAAPDGDHYVTYLALQGAPNATLELIAVTHSPQLELGPVVDDCGVLDEYLVLERLDVYLDRSGGERLEGPTPMTIDGATGYHEVLRYASYGFDIEIVWIYGQDSMFHVGCQYNANQDRVLAGCADLLDSVGLS